MSWITDRGFNVGNVISEAFKGSRLGGGEGWLGYGMGQWAPGANIMNPERGGVLGRMADLRAQSALTGPFSPGRMAPASQQQAGEHKSFNERMASPNNLLQLLLGERAQTPGPDWKGPSGEYPQTAKGIESGGYPLISRGSSYVHTSPRNRRARYQEFIGNPEYQGYYGSGRNLDKLDEIETDAMIRSQLGF